MPSRSAELHVQQRGRRTVVDFGEHEYLSLRTTQFRSELEDLIHGTGCRVLALDMSGVRAISSEVFGTIAWLLERVEVEILDPSEVVREVLSATRLDERVRIVADETALA
ncbi:MAG: hypothetical protein KY476_18795 [Planctomycetes bacterium]|nr:hypothetical protein [Planctomycetota bacterium]